MGKEKGKTVRIYVGNMPFSMDETQLRSLFEPYGQVATVDIITDRETGRPRGFGFVEMLHENEGRTAIQSLEDYASEGRTLNINEARPRENRGAGAGGGGSRRPRPSGGGRGFYGNDGGRGRF